jgi:uncharacterized protein
MVEDCQKIELILQVILSWATAQPKIRAVALVGSRARGGARPDSDIDLMLLTTDPAAFRADTTWVGQIDWDAIDTRPRKWQDEEYGAAWSRRVWLTDRCVQVELAFAFLSWANADPPDAGTQRVISDEMPDIVRPRCVTGSSVQGNRSREGRQSTVLLPRTPR